MKLKIIKNAAKCLLCGTVVESKSVHDWRACQCGAMFVDGGHQYARMGGYLNQIELLSVYEVVESGEGEFGEPR